ncbi:peptidoglycan-associated lipoprotein, partial [mine drainage metagenome]
GDAKVTLQGNCDERGSREYNLGLGQRRADSVRKILMAKGVKDSQIETVSFGKEKPVNPGHNAAAWAENRRTDIVYQGE